MEQNMTEHKGEIDKIRITVGDFNTSLLVNGRTI